MSEVKSSARILLVEDEAIIAMAETHLLASEGHEIAMAHNGEEAVLLAREGSFDLVLMDIDLGAGIDGGEAARRIHEEGGPPVIFLSSHSEETAIAKTRGSGAYGFILKDSVDRVLLASVRMALELALALRDLSDSESRWASLARNVAEYIVSIGPDGRILFSNRPLGGERGLGPGAVFSDFAFPQERPVVDQAIDRAFAERIFTRQLMHSTWAGGRTIAYEALFAPAIVRGKPDYLTAVLREVDLVGLPRERAFDAGSQREAEIAAAMSAFDFAPLRGLLDGFYAVTGLQISIIRAEERFLAATPFSSACAAFHRTTPASLALCRTAGKIAQAAEPAVDGPGFFEHLCPNGLRDIAMPLYVEGMRWGTIFVGQFLYDDDDPNEEDLARRARENGWDLEGYRAAIREIPRISRARMESILLFFRSMAQAASGLAASAYRELTLAQRLREAGVEPVTGESGAAKLS